MRRAVAVAALLLALPASAGDLAPVRMCAEWEPALGTVIAWPLKIPVELVRLLARDELVYVLVAYDDQEERARRALADWRIAPDHVRFVRTSVESEWTRDYGAHQVFDRRGRLVVVDPVYVDTPLFAADPPPVELGQEIPYHQRFPGDDRTNVDLAAFLGLPRWPMAAYLTGGNFLVDGHGAAFTTRAMLDENRSRMAEADFLSLVARLTGVETCHVLDNTEPLGIQHIDCWLKPLDEERLLVKRAPPGHPEHDRIERNVERLERLETCYGRPYEILRVDCPVYGSEPDFLTEEPQPALAAYTNSLILNRKVFVPLFGGPGDETALAVYRAALPGYEVHGFPFDGWRSFDALHCRTRAVFDADMLRLTHPRLRGPVAAGRPVEVSATVEGLGRTKVARRSVELLWRLEGEGEWRRLPLSSAGRPDAYRAAIPPQEAGAVVEYYLAAADRAGRRESLPRSAPAGFYTVTVSAGAP